MIAPLIHYSYIGSWSKHRESSFLGSRFTTRGDVDASFRKDLWWSNSSSSSSYRNTHWGPLLRGYKGESILDAGYIFAPEMPAEFITFDFVANPSVLGSTPQT